MRAGRLLPAVALLVVLPLPAGTDAQPGGLELEADAGQTGHVRLQLRAPAGLPLTIDEQGPAGAEQVTTLTPSRAETTLPRAVEWRCDRRVRTFVARAADGRSASASVRTPSCARRLAVAAGRKVRAGRDVRVLVKDRWGLGDLAIRLCVDPPGGPRECDARRLSDGEVALRTRFSTSRPGGWQVRAQTPYGSTVAVVRAAPPGGRLRLLATGDSMIQIIDGFLKQRLGARGVQVRSDARISTGISKPSLLNWPAHARRQVAGGRPDVTVMFLGANDGFSMGDAACCGRAWVAEYARRARGMMRTYGRAGRGRVYWLLLPAPRGGNFRRVYTAVNEALLRAGEGLSRHARLLRLDQLFTPGWRYRSSMRVGRRIVRVRQGDGVHLNTAGASLAASLIIRTLRRERIVR